jgi:ubiquinone/menaquinone biosynthesis C-methylase UbiE
MWGGAEYELVAREFAPVHDDLVAAVAPAAGERFLDVATGTGEVALRAARAGADVTALDFAPALLEQARAKGAAEGLAIEWIEGDAQAMPFEDGSFDVAASNFGVIFAPDAEAAASELARVCVPGGRLGVTAWLPDQGLHSLYARFVDNPRDDPVDRWGSREGLQALLQLWFDLEIEERTWNMEAESPEAAWELMSVGAPPVKALLESLDPDRRGEFRTAMIEHWQGFRDGDGVREPRRYLRALGRRR